MDLDLDNPIFVIYINVGGKSALSSKNIITQIQESYKYSNATMWIMPIEHENSRIELLWKGKNYSSYIDNITDILNEKSLKHLYKRLNEILNLISDGVSDSTLKQKIRDLQLNDLLDEI